MTPDDALQIIAAYGADSERWPDADRPALLALAANDAAVAAALDKARALDTLISDWATNNAPAAFDVAAITALPQERRALAPRTRLPLRWIGGGALAAAVAGLMILTPMGGNVSTPASVPSATASNEGFGGEVSGSDAEAFAEVFTPTADEEDLI